MLTLAGPIGPRTPARDLGAARRWRGNPVLGRRRAFQHRGGGAARHRRVSPGAIVAALTALGHAGIALWTALSVRERATRAAFPAGCCSPASPLPAPVLAAGFARVLLGGAAFAGILWWGGIFLTLHRPEDRIRR